MNSELRYFLPITYCKTLPYLWLSLSLSLFFPLISFLIFVFFFISLFSSLYDFDINLTICISLIFRFWDVLLFKFDKISIIQIKNNAVFIIIVNKSDNFFFHFLLEGANNYSIYLKQFCLVNWICQPLLIPKKKKKNLTRQVKTAKILNRPIRFRDCLVEIPIRHWQVD